MHTLTSLQEFAKKSAGNWGQYYYWQRISPDKKEAKRWCVFEFGSDNNPGLDEYTIIASKLKSFFNEDDPDIFTDCSENGHLNLCIRVFCEDDSITPVFRAFFELIIIEQNMCELAAQAQELNMGYE